MTKREGALAFGCPDAAQDRPQPDARLIRGPDLDRLVRVLRSFLGDGLLQPCFNASRSSGVAEAGWRGRGLCTDPPIAFSASQPRWGKTAASPRSPAIQAAPFELVHSPPSGGGARRRALSLSRRSGFRPDGLVPFRRRRSPRASRPSALSRASRRSTQRRAYDTVAETAAMSCPLARSQMAWTGRAAVPSGHERSFSLSADTLRGSATCAMARLRDPGRLSRSTAALSGNPTRLLQPETV
jgi:hypothetical protein